MAYPINPPAMPYMRRNMIVDAVYHDDGLVSSRGFWFWEPPGRETQLPTDWLVGPYRQRRYAFAARDRFRIHLGDGPELRTWEV